MGSVYLGQDTQLERQVAIKVPNFSAEESRQVIERFYREARAAATIHHPNICPVYDVGEIEGVPYLTMAYIDGKPLSDLASGPRNVTPRDSAILVRKLALALAEAHKHGVIHRDLKPANIMIDQRGEPVVMDFGLARRQRRDEARLTRQGAVMGTPAYMPPEQISGDVDAMGPGSDIYSLGVVMYELLAHQLPFGDTVVIPSEVLLDPPPPPSRFCPDLDPKLESICLKAMAKKASDRYASMSDLAGALQDYLRVSKSAAEQDEVLTSPSQTTKRPSVGWVKPTLGRTWIALGTGSLLVLLLCGWVLYLISNRPNQTIAADPPSAPVQPTIDNPSGSKSDKDHRSPWSKHNVGMRGKGHHGRSPGYYR